MPLNLWFRNQVNRIIDTYLLLNYVSKSLNDFFNLFAYTMYLIFFMH